MSGRTVTRLGNANASLEKIPENPQTRKAGRVANPEAKRVEGYGMGQGLGNMNKRTYWRRMYDGVLEYKEGVLFYSHSCNRKKFGFKNKKQLQNEVHTCKTNVHKSTRFEKTSSLNAKKTQGKI